MSKDKKNNVIIDNNKNIEGADPYVVVNNGDMYYCWSEGGIKVKKINDFTELNKDGGSLVYSDQSDNCHLIWAPELHYINGKWYIYAAMCIGSEKNEAHRMYCLECTGSLPTDAFKLVGKVTDKTDKWAIDGTVFKYGEELYTVWSGWEGDTDIRQDLYIARMSDPHTICSERVLLSSPSTWDSLTSNPGVNEGPCVIVKNNTVYILYSGNGSWTDDYAIGYLKCDNSNLMDAKSWEKSSEPILIKSKGHYGPGHCSVVKIGDKYYIIYHANQKSETGWGGRSVRVQELQLDEDKIRKVIPADKLEAEF